MTHSKKPEKIALKTLNARSRAALRKAGQPTKERARKAEPLIYVEDIFDERGQLTGKRSFVRDTCPLELYHAKGKLSDEQFAAGLWLERTWRRVAGSAHLTTNYERLVVGGPRKGGLASLRDPVVIGLRDLYDVLVQAGLARESDGRIRLTPGGRVALNVCALGEAAGRERKIEMLAAALDRLAKAVGVTIGWRANDEGATLKVASG